MSQERVFVGDMLEGGRFKSDDPASFTAYKRSLVGERVDVVMRKHRTKRSLDQNAYAHKWPFPIIAEAMGESVEAAKLCILGEKFGWHEVMGKQIPVKPSTAALTVDEFSELIEWMPAWAQETFGSVIPLPNEAP